MGYYADAGSHRDEVSFPAYGPIDSLFGFVVFYIFIERATPTIVDVFSTVTAMAPSTIGFGLAGLLWFIFVVTVLDVGRRQLAAVGVGSDDSIAESNRQRGVPSVPRALFYLGVVAIGGVVAVLTFETAVETGIDMIRIVGTLDTSGFDLVGFVVMILFFVSFGAATRALDRVVIGGVRALLSW
ncbi:MULTISPECIES: hypothetical protein [Haloferax]|uniref:Uncharacterized protein n=1 Tax=Haloferax marinum TaxID=2666143 RepID=A0A6A8GAW4_9EURY|nr:MULTISPECIES: hypothetical protein [Haloferax]KAB1190693.1 hypothetical protein Hfx1150_16790 [Haloferax sp. CBA1150]MRW98224.1 hypothetical protein [Haloferax marinum]